jgi:hypothetical protein
MAQGQTQPLKEMIIRNIPGGKGVALPLSYMFSPNTIKN